MNLLTSILTVVHLFTAVTIVALILLQQGKGADMGAAFGGGSSQSVFGARGSSSFLSRTTAVLAAMFFVTGLSLAYIYTQQSTASKSVVEQSTPMPEAGTAPADVPEQSGTDVPTVPGSDNGD